MNGRKTRRSSESWAACPTRKDAEGAQSPWTLVRLFKAQGPKPTGAMGTDPHPQRAPGQAHSVHAQEGMARTGQACREDTNCTSP